MMILNILPALGGGRTEGVEVTAVEGMEVEVEHYPEGANHLPRRPPEVERLVQVTDAPIPITENHIHL